MFSAKETRLAKWETAKLPQDLSIPKSTLKIHYYLDNYKLHCQRRQNKMYICYECNFKTVLGFEINFKIWV